MTEQEPEAGEEEDDDDRTFLDSVLEEIDDEDDNDDSSPHNNNTAGAAEAGIVRGVSRSVAQRAVAARSAGRSLGTAGRTVGKMARRAPKARAPASAMRVPKARGGIPKPAIPKGRGAIPKARVPKSGIPRGRPLPKGAASPKAAPRMPSATAAARRGAPTSATTTTSLTKRGVPVKQVAKVTDRMSTGLDVWDSVEETTATSESVSQQKRIQQLARVGAFVKTLVKNTVLGTIVFESYCWLVAQSDNLDHLSSNVLGKQEQAAAASEEEEGNNSVSSPVAVKDVFETVPVSVHYLAGAAAGSLQGLATNIWDISAASINARKLAIPLEMTPLSRSMTLQGVSHSVLFGTYESWKRLFLWRMGYFDHDHTTTITPEGAPQKRLEYFMGVATAGGLAGQLQHASSHILEQPVIVSRFSLPSLRSTMWAFPPSAIAFLAFEYGKDMVADLADDDEDLL